MPSPRSKENKGLPARWRLLHGAYYYKVPKDFEAAWNGKQLFRLGKTLAESYKVWAQRMGEIEHAKTVGQLLDRYALEVVPGKAPKTQVGNIHQIKELRRTFGTAPLTSIEPKHIYSYVAARTAKVAAHREIALLSHAYTKAVEWGYLNRHPFKREVRLAGEPPRTRYVEDAEIAQALALPKVRKRGSVAAIQTYIRIKLLTGLRRGDLLRLRLTALKDDGIHVNTQKTGKPVIYAWTEELRTAVADAKAIRPVDISPFLFCTKRGESYIDETTGDASGWNSMWQRFMDRLIDEEKITERFTEHDLRAKCASDAVTLEHARALLSHADSKLTNRVYRRKPEVVQPLR